MCTSRIIWKLQITPCGIVGKVKWQLMLQQCKNSSKTSNHFLVSNHVNNRGLPCHIIITRSKMVTYFLRTITLKWELRAQNLLIWSKILEIYFQIKRWCYQYHHLFFPSTSIYPFFYFPILPWSHFYVTWHPHFQCLRSRPYLH